MMKKIVIFSLISFLGLAGPAVALAAEASSFDVAQTFTIADPDVKDGDIVVSGPNGFVRASIPYDNRIFGVYSQNPLLVFRDAALGDKPIVRSGTTEVNVIAANGPINKGDYVTSSATAGKGEKALVSGYILGLALENFPGPGEGRIPVAIKVEYAELTSPRSANRLLEYLGASLLANAKDPERFGVIIRYIAAGLVVLAAFGLGFWTFSRTLPKGIEAIGRNPLARNTIYLSMVLNVGMIIVVGVLGIGAALLILRL